MTTFNYIFLYTTNHLKSSNTSTYIVTVQIEQLTNVLNLSKNFVSYLSDKTIIVIPVESSAFKLFKGCCQTSILALRENPI